MNRQAPVNPEKRMPPGADLHPEEKRILNAAQGTIEPIRKPVLYQVWLILVAVAMVLLPLIYVGLIVFAGWVVFWHATNNLSLFDEVSIRGAILAYFGPLVAGLIMIFFMIKPLFAPRIESAKPRMLTPAQHPLLFRYVEKICDAVSSPRPSQIQVDHQINASAQLRRGWRSLLGNDLTLTIGLPLASGLTVRQFSGVMAHEFGHFTQRAGMGFSFIIRAVSFWFHRVVYERDTWDQSLERQSRSAGGWTSAILYLARFFVWLTRRILWCLMWVGQAISCLLLRQMEYDADRHEIRLAGAKAAVDTTYRLNELNVAGQIALGHLQSSWPESRLAEDYPQLVVHCHKQVITEEASERLKSGIEKRETGWLDTHPADRDRIAAAQKDQSPGIFGGPDAGIVDELPAERLFRNFGELSKQVTRDFYLQSLGRQAEKAELLAIPQFLASVTEERSKDEALDRYFYHQFNWLRPLPLQATRLEAPADPGEAAAEIEALRSKLLSQVAEYPERVKRYGETVRQRELAERALYLIRANLRVAPSDFGLSKSSSEEAQAKRAEAEARLQEWSGGADEFESLMARRLILALSLLAHPTIAAKLQDEETDRARLEELVACAAELGKATPEVIRFNGAANGLADLTLNVENSPTEELQRALQSGIGRVRGELGALRSKLPEQPYPLRHAEGVTIREFLIPATSLSLGVGQPLETATDCINNFVRLYSRIMAELTQAAEQAEMAAGLPLQVYLGDQDLTEEADQAEASD